MKVIFIMIELASGFFYFHRTSQEIRTKNFVEHTLMTKIVASYLVWIFLTAIMCREHLFLFSVQVWWPVVAVQRLPYLTAQIYRRRLKRDLLPLISRVAVKVRMGDSLRVALLDSAEGASDFTRVKIEKLVEAMALTDGAAALDAQDEQVRDLLQFFKSAEGDPHRLVSRLGQYREKLQIEEEFVLKRSRALQQLQSQSVVLSLLYLGLLAYVSLHFGYFEYQKLIFTATFLFLVGVIVTQIQGRNFKWKV